MSTQPPLSLRSLPSPVESGLCLPLQPGEHFSQVGLVSEPAPLSPGQSTGLSPEVRPRKSQFIENAH